MYSVPRIFQYVYSFFNGSCQPLKSMSILPYTPYSNFLARHFDHKIQKLPVDVGFTCPVRDGHLSRGGCSFCNGRSFVPDMCDPQNSVSRQIESGKEFFKRKYKSAGRVGYLAYFQSGSNTYAPPTIAAQYMEEALACSDVEGIVLATRPDCLSAEWLSFLQEWRDRTFIMVELGVESVNDEVLRRVGRGHDASVSRWAIMQLAGRQIPVGVHSLLGLPGETRTSMLQQAEWLSTLPVSVLKLHQLQILRGARMAFDYQTHPENYALFEPDEYAVLVADFLERLSPTIAVERFVSQSPAGSLIAPRWGLKNDALTHLIVGELQRRGSWQGKYLKK